MVTLAAMSAAAALTACGPPSDSGDDSSSSSGGTDAKTATSADDFGGMDALVDGGKEGGHAQRHRAAAGLGELRRDHQGVHRRSTASRSTVRPARRLQPGRDQRGQAAQGPADGAPDVFDLGAVGRAGQHRHVRAVQGGDLRTTSRTTFKDAERPWVNDYGGYMSIGYDSAKVPASTSRRRPAQARRTRARSPSTATRPRPARRSAACVMASIANGGSADDIAPGRRLLQAAQERRQLPAGRPDAGHHRVRPDPGRHRLGLPERRADRQARRSLEDRRPARTRSSAATTSRRSTRTPRTRRPPGCGRSSSTPTRARTSGSRAAPARCAPTRWSRPARSTRRAYDALPPVDGHAGPARPGADRQGGGLPGRQLGQGDRLTAVAPVARHRSGAPPRRPARSRRRRRCLARAAAVLRLRRDLPGHARRSSSSSARSWTTTAGFTLGNVRRSPTTTACTRSCSSRRASRRHRGPRRRARARCWPTRIVTAPPNGLLRAGWSRPSAACSPSSAASRWPSPSSPPRLHRAGDHLARRQRSASTSAGSLAATSLTGPDARLHLLPDPADGHRVPARRSTACARSGVRRPRTSAAATWQYWRHVARPAAAARVPRLRCCCCSPTPSRPTPPPRP